MTFFNRKIEIEFEEKESAILDGQSKILNWFYNHLLQEAKDDYEKNAGKKKLLSGKNLRNHGTSLKKEFPFLKTVHSSPLKNAALRLKETYDRMFTQGTGYPKYRAWKRKWFSLFFDEPDKGWKIVKDNQIRISLGKVIDEKTGKGTQCQIFGSMKESLELQKGDIVKTFRLCKKRNKFYGIFTIERKEITPKEGTLRWLSIDPNHKNLFTCIDYLGETLEFMKIKQIKYWDRKIDELKSKRDKCNRKAKEIKTPHGKSYFKPSDRWNRLNKALERAYQCREEQIKVALFTMANFMAQNYDVVAIGDYTPSLETAVYDTMHRSMLNQEKIGEFRRILKWVMERSGKTCIVVDEHHTTKACCMCGFLKKKDPSIREFECEICNTKLGRDINSAVNIARKAGLFIEEEIYDWFLEKSKYYAMWDYRKSRIKVS